LKILSLLFVPKCSACRCRISADSDSALCEMCREKWEKEKMSVCPDCGQKTEECWCGVKSDVKHYIYSERHLSNYTSKRESATKRIILNLKKKENRPAINMVADELAHAVRVFNSDPENTVVVSVPRSVRSIKEFGFDQAYLIADRMSEDLGYPHVVALVHKGCTMQKTLDMRSRAENAKKSYFASDDAKEKIKGKTVILVDDIITTGATAVRCAQQLKRSGASKIHLATIAKVY